MRLAVHALSVGAALLADLQRSLRFRCSPYKSPVPLRFSPSLNLGAFRVQQDARLSAERSSRLRERLVWLYRAALFGLCLAACGSPPSAPTFPVDLAIGAFARDPASPVIARSADPTAPDYAGATAPSVWQDGSGFHAAYLAIDVSGGASLLAADSPDGKGWTKRVAPLVPTTPGLGRPAALAGDGGVLLFYAQADGDGGSEIVGPGGAVVIPGAAEPCALAVGAQLWIYAVAADGAIHGYLAPAAAAPFVDQGIVLRPGPDGGFDDFAVSAPSALVETSALGRSLFRLWYTGTDQPGGTPSIGLAGSFDGVTFESFPNNPVRFHGDLASVFATDGGYAMLYSETPASAPTDISLAARP